MDGASGAVNNLGYLILDYHILAHEGVSERESAIGGEDGVLSLAARSIRFCFTRTGQHRRA